MSERDYGRIRCGHRFMDERRTLYEVTDVGRGRIVTYRRLRRDERSKASVASIRERLDCGEWRPV